MLDRTFIHRETGEKSANMRDRSRHTEMCILDCFLVVFYSFLVD